MSGMRFSGICFLFLVLPGLQMARAQAPVLADLLGTSRPAPAASTPARLVVDLTTAARNAYLMRVPDAADDHGFLGHPTHLPHPLEPVRGHPTLLRRRAWPTKVREDRGQVLRTVCGPAHARDRAGPLLPGGTNFPQRRAAVAGEQPVAALRRLFICSI